MATPTKWEDGPVVFPTPYGSNQPTQIYSNNPVPPVLRQPSVYGTGRSGQNQPQKLPTITAPMEIGPIKADPKISQITPAPIMGPAPQGTQPFSTSPDPGVPFPNATFPIPGKNYIDGLGSVVTPTRIIGGLGN